MGADIQARFALALPGFELRVDVGLPGRGISAIYGPSGAGKTLFLRTVAGLERGARGRLEINGELWQDEHGAFVPTHRRRLGYVFQEASLFPHLTVRGNLEYARRRSGDPGDLGAVADMLGIGALLQRRPEALSGGERQRVAIARALLARPQLLLFDEPLASLDLRRRLEILPYLERLHDELRIPALYVTHMPDEVARLADHLVLLDQGRAVASGPAPEILARLDLPAPFTEHAGVVIEAECSGYDADDRLARLTFSGGTLLVPHASAPRRTRVRCRIEARDVSVTLARQSGTSILNIVPAEVVDAAEIGPTAQVLARFDANGTAILAHVTRHSWHALGLAAGKRVWLQIKAVALVD